MVDLRTLQQNKMSTLAQLLSYANTGAALSGAGMLALYITPYNFVVKQAALRFITESPLIRKVRECVCGLQVSCSCILALLALVGVGVGWVWVCVVACYVCAVARAVRCGYVGCAAACSVGGRDLSPHG